MQTHQLNMSDNPQTNPPNPSPAPNQMPATPNPIPVDDPMLVNHNQPSGPTVRQYSSSGSSMPKKQSSVLGLIITIVLATTLGVGTGFAAQKMTAGSTPGSSQNTGIVSQLPSDSVKEGDVFGSADDTFPDMAEGYLEAGGIDGEGSHSLLRPGGASQTVYLTSSITDLSKLEGMQVKVWGETFKGQKAGWLMDVGRIEVQKNPGAKPE